MTVPLFMDGSKLNDALGLGTWLGRKQAFGLLAGKCSAADAECLRKMRDAKKYRALGMNWENFCRTQIGISRGAAEKIIKLLEEFGPKYFELSAVVRITPDEYRRIAPAVTDGGLRHRGRLLEIAIENGPQLAEAVGQLKKETEPPPAAVPAAPADLDRSIQRARRWFREGTEVFRKAAETPLDLPLRLRLMREMGAAMDEMLAVGKQLMPF